MLDPESSALSIRTPRLSIEHNEQIAFKSKALLLSSFISDNFELRNVKDVKLLKVASLTTPGSAMLKKAFSDLYLKHEEFLKFGASGFAYVYNSKANIYIIGVIKNLFAK